MADEFGANRETIPQILVEDLGRRKVASRFVPHSLSDDQRHERVYKSCYGMPRQRNKSAMSLFLSDNCYEGSHK